jgi:hypothetical protein
MGRTTITVLQDKLRSAAFDNQRRLIFFGDSLPFSLPNPRIAYFTPKNESEE